MDAITRKVQRHPNLAPDSTELKGHEAVQKINVGVKKKNVELIDLPPSKTDS